MAEQRSSSSSSSNGNGKKQRGGTFLSFVGGVVVGLGVALAVAMYVSKVPIPFLNKNQPRNAEQDAAEVLKNKGWDPNAALYGKNPAPRQETTTPPAVAATPAPEPALPTSPPPPLDDGAAPDPAPARPARATANATAAARAAAVLAPAVERPAPVAVARTAPPAAASNDPLGDLAAKRAQPRTVAPVATAAAATTADPYNYLVQAGAYNSMSDAEAQRARLSILGIESKITERDQSGRTIYRVRVGPFDSKDSADRVKERLDSSGNVSTLLRVQR